MSSGGLPLLEPVAEQPPFPPRPTCGTTGEGGGPAASGDHTGWLQKAGHIRKDFKRRFFILRGTRLAYYEDRAAANRGKSKGEVTVCKVRHLHEGEGADLTLAQRPLAFFFDTLERKPFVVYADSMREKQAWLRALLGAISGGAAAPASGPVSAVEDLYRDQVSAAEAGDDATAVPAARAEEQAAWSCIAKGAQLIRAQMYAEARARFEEALDLAGYRRGGGASGGAAAGGGASAPPSRTTCLAALYELGKLLCETGEYSAALPQFEAAMGMAPPYVHLQLKLQCAWCAWRLGRPEQAGGLYQGVLEEDPLCWQASLDRARMHLGCGSWASALPDLENVIGMGQSSAEVLNDLGVCYYELGEYDTALRSFNGAVGLNPEYPQAYTNRGNCCRKMGRMDDALHDYSKAVDLDDTNPKSFNNRGALCLRMADYSAAIGDFEKALELDPAYEVARRNREVAREVLRNEHAAAEKRSDLYRGRVAERR